jgi:starch synthase
MTTSEVAPFAKTGGLGDVLGALPRALRHVGIDVAVVMPAYGSIARDRFHIEPMSWSLSAPVADRMLSAGVLRTDLGEGVPVYLIDAPSYFDRPALYGTADGDYVDNAERFAFFSRAVLALLPSIGVPDVLHCHDWQSGMTPAFLRADAARYPGLERVRTVHTIHNIGYQGIFTKLDWPLLNLDWRYFTAEWLEFYDRINYLKGGIVFADAITTVSPTYAREIQTPTFGYGLDGVLAARRHVLSGILNGADYDEWSPETDPLIAKPYSADKLRGKAACKADLQRTFGLPTDPKVPVLGIVSRLVDQKGFDLIAAVVPTLLERPLQLVVLGTGEARYHRLLEDLAAAHPQRLAVRIAFDNVLAHKIEAGSDIFLMPSRYEPCGLNQLYSLRYGTIPVVHATGGLEDTIDDFDSSTGQGSGFKFRDYTPGAFLGAVERALQVCANPPVWSFLVRNAMRRDFSWDRSAMAYADFYARLCTA